jgi:hypothetical protein
MVMVAAGKAFALSFHPSKIAARIISHLRSEFNFPDYLINPQQVGHGFLELPKVKGVDEEARGRLSGHGFSTGTSLLICGSKAAGVPRGMALLVAGRSPRRGGREQSDRWKGESATFLLQRDAVGNERADESMPEPSLELPAQIE